MTEGMTTAEWMALPLTEEDVAYVDEFLNRIGGVQSVVAVAHHHESAGCGPDIHHQA